MNYNDYLLRIIFVVNAMEIKFKKYLNVLKCKNINREYKTNKVFLFETLIIDNKITYFRVHLFINSKIYNTYIHRNIMKQLCPLLR